MISEVSLPARGSCPSLPPTLTEAIRSIRLQPGTHSWFDGISKIYGHHIAAAALGRVLGCPATLAATALYRVRHPRSRVESVTYYSVNSGNARQKSAIFGGAGPSWCGSWPETQRAIRWERDVLAEYAAADAAVAKMGPL